MSSIPIAAGLLLALFVGVLMWLAARDRKAERAAAFMIGRRDVGWFATMASVVGNLRDGAGLAAWVVLGIYYGFGALWLTAGLIVGLIVLAAIAPAARELAVRDDYISVTQLLRDRMGPMTARLSTFVIGATGFLYAAAQVHVSGRIYASLLDWPTWGGMLLVVVVVASYLVIGGYAASVRTGIFQWFVIMVVVLIPWLVGGAAIPTPSGLLSTGLVTGTSFAAISLLVTISSADLWQLIFSSRSARDARIGFGVSAPVYIVISVGMILFAMASSAAVGQGAQPNDVFFSLFGLTSLPPLVLGTVGVFVAAAVMSTLDSQVFLVSSTIVGRSNVQSASEDTERKTRRVIVAVMACLGLLAAGIVDLVTFLFSAVTLATILSPVFIGAVLRPRFVSDAACATVLLIAAAVYAVLFARGAFANLAVTLVPCAVSVAGLGLLVLVKKRQAVQP
jgi:Na+/proline symporter